MYESHSKSSARPRDKPLKVRTCCASHDDILFIVTRITNERRHMGHSHIHDHRRRPRRPPWEGGQQTLQNETLIVESKQTLRRVESVGIGVTSSMRPMRMPERARARRALWAPGPGVLVPVPPDARNLTWRAVIPTSRQRVATSCAASIAAYGDDSSRSALTFIPPSNDMSTDSWHDHGHSPVTREIVSLPDKSVTWTKVSLNEA